MEDVADTSSQLGRRSFLRWAGSVAVTGAGATILVGCGSDPSPKAKDQRSSDGRPATLYQQEGCSCCVTYARYLESNGFSVKIETVDDLEPIRVRYKIPAAAIGCHTSVIEGHVVEGHVPVKAIDSLLAESPNLDGISVVGMPANSPGMGQPNGEPLEILSFAAGRVRPYMSVTTF